MGYSLQANRKTLEGARHPDRDAQFEHINATVAAAFAARQPVISVDAKKRELVGDFKAVGRELAPGGEPVKGPHPRLQRQATGTRDPVRRL
jgi:hypothetical protein